MTQPLSLKKEKNQGINNSINNQRKAKEETRPETVNPSSLTMATFIIGVIKLVSLSLCWIDSNSFTILTESLLAKNPWHIQRRVVPSRQMYEKPFS
jgi:hypothetical protein